MQSFFFIIIFCYVANFLASNHAVNGVNFQYKQITLGVIIAPETLSTKIPETFKSEFKLDVAKALSGEGVEVTKTSKLLNRLNKSKNSKYISGPERVSEIEVLPLTLDLVEIDGLKEISALLTYAGCNETHNVNQRISQGFGVIFQIAFTDPGCERLDPARSITIPLTWFANDADLLQAFVDLRQTRALQGWMSATLIHDVQTGQSALDNLLDSLSSNQNFNDVPITLFSVDSFNRWQSFSGQLEEIFEIQGNRKGKNYIFFTSVKNINSILEAAGRMGVLKYMNQLLFVSPDANLIKFRFKYIETRIIDDGVNVAFMFNSSKASGQNTDLVDCYSKAILKLFSNTIEELANKEYYHYLQVSDEEWDIVKTTRKKRVSQITLKMKAELLNATRTACNKSESSWDLKAAEFGRNGKTILKVGTWTPAMGLSMQDDLFPHITGGFRGRTISVASFHFPPWQIIEISDTKSKVIKGSGLMFEIMNQLSLNLNFSYEIILPTDGTWGSIQSDGNWNGLMQLIVEDKVLFGAAACTVTPERAQYINFTEVIEREAYGFIVNRPRELSRVLLFAEPFQLEVWICIACAVLIVPLVLNFIHKNSKYYDYFNLNNGSGFYQLRNCYWYIFGALVQQGGVFLPEASSGRMLISFWWIFVVVSVTTYSGNLVAYLTFPKVESPVSSFDDIVRYHGVKSWGFLQDSPLSDHLKLSDDPDMIKFSTRALRYKSFDDKVIKLVKSKDHAHIDWTIVLKKIIRDRLLATGACDFSFGDETIFEEKLAIPVPRGSPYLHLLNKEIKQMLQIGLIKKWKSKYWPPKDKCSMKTISGNSKRVVTLGDMQGSFYLLGLGFLFSVLLLLVEKYLRTEKRNAEVTATVKILVSTKESEFLKKNNFPFIQ